jgi:hypothetical protein
MEGAEEVKGKKLERPCRLAGVVEWLADWLAD